MSRLIDAVPEPAEKAKSPKLFVVSASRTGTLGLYKALGMLGYRPYHMVEVAANGTRDCRLFAEAIRSMNPEAAAREAREAGRPPPTQPLRPYGRAELDRWFAGYDAVLEVPSYLGPAVFDAYAADPDVRFILTERGPDAWVRSFDRAVGAFVRATRALPLRLFRRFDTFNDEFAILANLMWNVCAEGRAPEDPAARPALRRRYVEYIDWVKAHAPADRLRVIRLEDGLGWEEFCDFLGRDVPAAPYPRGNDPDEFAAIAGAFLAPGVRKAVAVLTAAAVPLVGGAAWLAWRHGGALLRRIR